MLLGKLLPNDGDQCCLEGDMIPGNFNHEVNHSIVDLEPTYNTTAYLQPTGVVGWRTQGQGVVHGVFLVLFTIAGSLCNIFMIVAIVPNRRLRTVRNMLLVHLGIVGLISSMSTTLYAGVVSLSGHWVGGEVTCQLYGFVQSTFTLVSVWTISALSWDKYQTIASPLHHSMTAKVRKMTITFAVFWVCAIILAIPPLLGKNKYVFYPIAGTCFMNHLDVPSRWYVGIFVCFMFYIPLLVMLYCYTHIFRIARTQSSRIAATMVRMACVVQAPIAPNTPSTSNSTIKGTKAMMTILQLVGAFAVTYIPYSVFILFEACAGSRTLNPMLISIVTTLFQAAPMTNSAIYGIRNKILRKSFMRYTRRKIHLCWYKDKRRGSVKSIRRSSSFRMSLLQRKGPQKNGGPVQGVLRRTQSLQVKKSSRSNLFKFDSVETLRKSHSFTLQNGHHLSNSDEMVNDHSDIVLPARKSMVTNLRKISDVQHEQEEQVNSADENEIKILIPNGVVTKNVTSKPQTNGDVPNIYVR